MASSGPGQVLKFGRSGAAETSRRSGRAPACPPGRVVADKPAVSRRLPPWLLLASLLVHGALVAALFWGPTEKMPVGTDERVHVVSVELVAARAAPDAAEPKRPAIVQPTPPEKTVVKKPVVKKRVVKKTNRKNPASVVMPSVIAPVAAPSADGASRMSSPAIETRAEGRRAYGRLVWKKIAERKPAGLHLAGTADVGFSVTAEGAIGRIGIVRSSGNAELDALALRTIGSAAPFDAPPADLAPGDLVFEIPFNFR